MEGVETIYNRPTRTMEESTRAVSSVTLDNREFTQTHRCVLFNSENIYQFHEMHKSVVEEELRRGHRCISKAIIHKHDMEKFCGWFRSHVHLTSSTSKAFNFPISRITGKPSLGSNNVEGMIIDASIIGERDLHEMDNLDDCEFIDDESNDEDDNEVEYSDDEQCMGKRKRQLALVYVGKGSSHGRQRVEAQDEEAHISQEARPIASDNDEIQALDDLEQTPTAENAPKRHGPTRLANIWALDGSWKIQLPLNDEGQPIGPDDKTFV
nr:hypothetical protein CFP56_55586 [Quercus suber]